MPDFKKKNFLKISPTSYGKFDRCKRLWTMERMLGFASETTATLAGSKAHKFIENMLKKEPYVDDESSEHVVAELWYKYMKAEGFLERLESSERKLPTPCGRFNGQIDFIAKDEDGTVVVGDFKTTSNPRYIKKPKELANDIAANLYAYAASHEYDVDEVRCLWLYSSVNNPTFVTPVSVTITREDATRKFSEAMAVLEEQEKLLDSQTLAPTPTSISPCFAFGGCPYIIDCETLGPGQVPKEEAIAKVGRNFVFNPRRNEKGIITWKRPKPKRSW